MKVSGEMIFLGVEERKSNKTGNEYQLVKIMDLKTKSIFEMYVPSDRLELRTMLGTAKMLVKCLCHFEVSSYNSKMQIDLVGMEV